MVVHKYFDKFVKLGHKITHEEDTPWEYTEEPHSSRRREILKKYPQIKKLMGYDVRIAYIVLAEVFVQMCMCYLVCEASWTSILIAAYVIGGTLNHSLGASIHEIGHNLAFGHGRPLWNRALGMVSNLPMGIPFSVTYKRYHADHHKFLGHDTLDVDVPTVIESWFFRHPITKFIWLVVHPLIHGVRPFCKSPKVPSTLELINTAIQLSFDVLIYFTFGHKALIYLIGGTLLGLGAHPLAAHFISEHYLFTKGHATLSYYGPLNPILFNVGYHIEHHDFPYIPGTRLPEVKRIAAEFYDDVPCHASWLKVLWDFVFDTDMGPHARGVGYLQDDVNRIKATDAANKGEGVITNGHVSNGQIPNEKVANGQIPNGNVANGHIPNGNVANGQIPNGEGHENVIKRVAVKS